MDSYWKSIVKRNNFTHICIQNDYEAGYSRGFSVYLMSSESIGVKEKSFKTKRQALGYAQQIANQTGLDIKK